MASPRTLSAQHSPSWHWRSHATVRDAQERTTKCQITFSATLTPSCGPRSARVQPPKATRFGGYYWNWSGGTLNMDCQEQPSWSIGSRAAALGVRRCAARLYRVNPLRSGIALEAVAAATESAVASMRHGLTAGHVAIPVAAVGTLRLGLALLRSGQTVPRVQPNRPSCRARTIRWRG
jgi:hypothetical protein